MIDAMPIAFTLRVRGEPIGLAYGTENWFRAVSFVCDRLGRTETTPSWAIDASIEVPISVIAKGYSGNGDDAGAED